MEDEGSPPLKKLKCLDNEIALVPQKDLEASGCNSTTADNGAENFQNTISNLEGSGKLVDHVLRPVVEAIDKDEIMSEVKDDVVEKASKRLSENDVGITEYINEFAGISGILKQRYSDFVVRERNLERQLVKLTDTKYKEPECNKSVTEELVPEEEKSAKDSCPLSDEDMAKITSWLEKVEKEECKEKLVLSADNDKGHRTLVHEFIREKYEQLGTESCYFSMKNMCYSSNIKLLKC